MADSNELSDTLDAQKAQVQKQPNSCHFQMKVDAITVYAAKVLKNGKQTIPIEDREISGIEEGDIVRLGIIGVYRKGKDGNYYDALK